MTILEEVARRGAVVFDVAAGQRVIFHEDTVPALAFIKCAREEGRKGILAQARAQKAALGAHRGPPVRLAGAARNEAKEAWEDKTLTANNAVKKTGVSESTLRRQFGPKGTPRFGRKNKGASK